MPSRGRHPRRKEKAPPARAGLSVWVAIGCQPLFDLVEGHRVVVRRVVIADNRVSLGEKLIPPEGAPVRVAHLAFAEEISLPCRRSPHAVRAYLVVLSHFRPHRNEGQEGCLKM